VVLVLIYLFKRQVQLLRLLLAQLLLPLPQLLQRVKPL
jgi:hypothetical protein